MDHIPTPVIEECVKAVRQRGAKREEVLVRALLELFQVMSFQIPEIRTCYTKEIKVTRELLERVRSLKEYRS